MTVVSFGMRWTPQGKSCLKHLKKDYEAVFGLWQTPERKQPLLHPLPTSSNSCAHLLLIQLRLGISSDYGQGQYFCYCYGMLNLCTPVSTRLQFLCLV